MTHHQAQLVSFSVWWIAFPWVAFLNFLFLDFQTVFPFLCCLNISGYYLGNYCANNVWFTFSAIMRNKSCSIFCCSLVPFWSQSNPVVYVLADEMFTNWKQMIQYFLCILFLTYSCSSTGSNFASYVIQPVYFFQNDCTWKCFCFLF